MSLSLYPLHVLDRTCSVVAVFRYLRARSDSAEQACDRLNDLLKDDRVVVDPKLEPGARFVPGGDDGIILMNGDAGPSGVRRIFMRQRGRLDAVPAPPAAIAAMYEGKGALVPLPAEPAEPRRVKSGAEVDRGGREPEHNWEGAAVYVDGKKPLALKANGTPNKQGAIDLMLEWFETNDPPAPEPETVRRWLNKEQNQARIAGWWPQPPRGGPNRTQPRD